VGKADLERAGNDGFVPMRGPSTDPVVGVTGWGSIEDTEVPVRSPPPAFEDVPEMQAGDASAEVR
jgi:hypothetical protein